MLAALERGFFYIPKPVKKTKFDKIKRNCYNTQAIILL